MIFKWDETSFSNVESWFGTSAHQKAVAATVTSGEGAGMEKRTQAVLQGNIPTDPWT